MNLKEVILSAKDCKIEKVEVEEWGVTVGIKVFGGFERDKFEDMIQKRSKNGGKDIDVIGLRAEACSMGLVDPATGKKLFTSKEDIDALNTKNADVLTRLFDKISSVNGIGDDEIEVIEKN